MRYISLGPSLILCVIPGLRQLNMASRFCARRIVSKLNIHLGLRVECSRKGWQKNNLFVLISFAFRNA